MRALQRRVLSAAALLLIVACERPAGDGPGDDGARYGGTAVVAIANDLDAANAFVSQERYTKEMQRYVLFMTLVRPDSAMVMQPYLAESWEMLGDTGVVFHLRDDVYWHDSVRTTAYDVEFTFDRIKDPLTAFPDADYFKQWESVAVQDSFTIRFGFRPHADPLVSWAFTAIMPRHLLSDVTPDAMRNAPFNKRPVGNGPFRFVEYRPNDRWIFAANPDFPRELGGRPRLDRLVFRVIPERTAGLNELETGTVDLVLNAGADHIQRLDSLPDIRGIVRPSRLTASIFWNGKRPPFGDARVRRALSMAIDRQELLDALRAGYGELAVSPVPPSHWAFDPALEPLPFDTAQAAALLQEAGLVNRNGDRWRELPDGRPLRFGLKIPANHEFSRDVAVMVQSDLAAVGVRMDVVPTEAATLFADVGSPERRFDAVFMAWEPDLRINLHDAFHSSAMEGNFQAASFSNPQADSLIDALSETPNRERALPLWHRFQRILRDQQPWTFLYFYPDLLAARERLKGVHMDLRGVFVGVRDWWIPEDASAAGDSLAGDSLASGGLPPDSQRP